MYFAALIMSKVTLHELARVNVWMDGALPESDGALLSESAQSIFQPAMCRTAIEGNIFQRRSVARAEPSLRGRRALMMSVGTKPGRVKRASSPRITSIDSFHHASCVKKATSYLDRGLSGSQLET